MSSDPPLHVALGPDLRRPSVRLLKLIRTCFHVDPDPDVYSFYPGYYIDPGITGGDLLVTPHILIVQ